METGVRNAERFEAPGRSPEEVRNVAKVREIFDALSRSDFAAFYSFLRSDAETEVVGLTPELMGKHAENPEIVPQTFDRGMLFTIEAVAAEGDGVFVQWSDVAETSTGHSYANRGLSVFHFDADAMVRSYREFLDPNRVVEVF